jgi:hypothetical protein
VNAALRLINLCPPAFPPIHFEPRTQTVRKSSFLRSPIASKRTPNFILSPLCFHGLTNCFSRKPFIIKNICVAPPGVPPNRSSEAQLRRLADHAHLSPSLSTNCALLFSLAALFRTPILCFQYFADSFCKSGGWEYPFYSSLRFNPVLRVLCKPLGRRLTQNRHWRGRGGTVGLRAGATGPERPFLGADAQIQRGRLRGG